DDLMLAALEDHDRRLQDMFRTLVAEFGGTSPIGQLHAVIDVVERIVEEDGFQGCIFVNAAIEFPLAHEPAHLAAARSKQAIEELVYDVAVAAGANDARALAKQLCLVMEGAYVTRHVTGNKHTIEIARRLAKLIIENGCPEGAGAYAQ